MSNPLKAVGKVFKKVAKVVMKVAPFALAATAVIFTGGAALGLLPTFSAAVGGLVSGLGLSAGLTGAITGAVTSAGFGSALGFITGGKKGMQKGFLMGALTGGVMGAVNPGMFGIAKTLDAAGNTVVTTTNALAHGGNAFGAAGKGAFTVTKDAATGLYHATPKAGQLGSSMAAASSSGALGPSAHPVGSNGVDPLAPLPDPLAPLPDAAAGGMMPASGTELASQPLNAVAAPQAPAVAAPTAPSSTGGMGGFGKMLENPMIMGSMLQGVGGMLGGSGDSEAEERMKFGEWGYGGLTEANPDPMGTKAISYPGLKPRYYYDPVANTIVDRNQTGG